MKADHLDDPRYRFIAIPVWDENENSNFEFEHEDKYTHDIQADWFNQDFCVFKHQWRRKGWRSLPINYGIIVACCRMENPTMFCFL